MPSAVIENRAGVDGGSRGGGEVSGMARAAPVVGDGARRAGDREGHREPVRCLCLFVVVSVGSVVAAVEVGVDDSARGTR